MAFLSTVLRSVVCFMIIKGVLGDPLEKIKNVPIMCLQMLICNKSLYFIWTGEFFNDIYYFSTYVICLKNVRLNISIDKSFIF